MVGSLAFDKRVTFIIPPGWKIRRRVQANCVEYHCHLRTNFLAIYSRSLSQQALPHLEKRISIQRATFGYICRVR